MTTASFTLRDSATMLRRDMRHSFRNFAMTLSGLMTPIIMLALFVYVFGGAMGAALGGMSYINYVAPAIIIMTIGSGCATTAINLCMDLNEGIISRFRTMPIARSSVLTGQVAGSLLRTMTSVLLVIGAAMLMGFRPTADLVEWLEAIGIILLFTFAITWMAIVFGLVGKTPAGANSLSLIFQFLLPFISSAFVQPDSMPEWIRGFAKYQPFTVVIDSVRGLLLGTPLDNSTVILAIVWCVAIALFGYTLARKIYNREPTK